MVTHVILLFMSSNGGDACRSLCQLSVYDSYGGRGQPERREKDMTLVVKLKTSVTHLRIILDVLMNVRKTQKAMTESGTTDSAMLG